MKRFQSSLQRLLRVREQVERMAQLDVSQARSEVEAAKSRLSVARASAALHLSELADRLNQPTATWVITQASDALTEQQSQVEAAVGQQALKQNQLEHVLAAFHAARQERELVERAVTRQRDEHRRETQHAAAIDLQEWTLRRSHGPFTGQEDMQHA